MLVLMLKKVNLSFSVALCISIFVHVDGEAFLREFIGKKKEHFLIRCVCVDYEPIFLEI